jgi:TonB family protein
MAKDPPSQTQGAASRRFWRNVVLIALAHAALIAGLIRWSVAARVPPNPESIVWLGSTEGVATGESEDEASLAPKQARPPVEAKPRKDDEPEEETPPLITAKSEIELPSPTPKPTPASTPRPKSTAPPTPKPRSGGTTPKPIPKPTPKKTVVTKASPIPAAKRKPSPAKASAKPEKKDKITLAKKDPASRSGSVQSGSTDKAASAGGGNSASEFGWYGNMLHDRFYSAWIQPTTNVPSGTKISTLVKVRIEKDGRVSKFEIAKPSENATVNESVAAVAKQISQVDPPPTGLIKGDHYDVKINFELNTEEKTPN